ncbi:bacterial type II and III secretion system family protein [Collimonas fungivorans]|uniref:Bacterial type II and III secretion system family protein n=1 Tax=Collimonas fungivorans TaxID=158899 RepID=A0A127PCC6_9BURK|nr:secretin N-terminal domain-containing protein [Collimonas fungivorans]AMO95387.1 bacterial type II and III secretion system family protein [Collimonas fungivorans]
MTHMNFGRISCFTFPAVLSRAATLLPAGSRTILLFTLVASIAACTQIAVQQSARQAFDEGRVEDSMAQLQDALNKNPQDAQLRVTYLGLRERAINRWLNQQATSTSASERTQLLRRILALDPDNRRAAGELEKIDRDAQLAKSMLDAQFSFDAKDYAAASRTARSVLTEDPYNSSARRLMKALTDKASKPSMDPELQAALGRKLSIEFKDAMLKQVFEVLSRTSDINFVLDKDIKSDQRTSVFLKGVTVKDALDVVLMTNQLEQRVIGRNAIMIYPNLPAKQKDYQSLSVHTFYTANADVEQLANTLKTILKTRDLIVDKNQNMIIMRDTPDAIEMAEKIVSMADLPTPETMLEVEILEINRNLLKDVGISYPPKLSLSPLASTSGGAVTLADLIHAKSSTTGATIDPLAINLTATDTDIRLLANPRIRVKNRESAKILIGDRVPNITSTATSTGFVSQSVQYLDVGLKLEVTPVITIDNEVSIKVALEVSNIANQITTTAGTVAYQIGTRSASTVLRLKDGENQILAGLINDNDTDAVTKIPGLGDIPYLGRLFSSRHVDHKKTEIVLSITPHLIRNSVLPAGHLLDFQSGTESSLRGAGDGGFSPRSDSGSRPTPPVPTTPTNAGGSATPKPSTDATSAAGIGSSGNSAGDIGNAGGSGSVNANAVVWIGASQAVVGTNIQQQLVLTSGQGVSGVNFVVGYDPTVLRIDRATEGTFLSADGTATTFTQRIDASTGQIFISDARSTSAAAGATGQAALVTLNVTPLIAAASTQLKVLSLTPSVVGGSSLSLTPPTQTIAVTAVP